jgi:uncharacterized protein YeaO (DUF488 family)
MPVRIVQLGSPRHPDEGLRIGTVRRPPRGVSKSPPRNTRPGNLNSHFSHKHRNKYLFSN